MVKPISPYKIFQDWLFNPLPDLEFPESIIKAINKRSVLSSLGKLNGVTIWLNKNFNNFGLMTLDDIDFYKFIRENVIFRYNVKRHETSFYKHEKSNKNLKQLQLKLPHLKQQEIGTLLILSKDDDDYDGFCENLGIYKTKKKKTTAKIKKEMAKREEEIEVIPSGITYKFWASQFGIEARIEKDIAMQQGVLK